MPRNPALLVLALAAGCVAAPERAAEKAVAPEPFSIDLGAGNVGLSVGNAPVWDGLRINFRDAGIRDVGGINVTLGWPGKNPDSTVSGLAVGLLAPAADVLGGVHAGGLFTLGGRSLTGIGAAGLAHVGGGALPGFDPTGNPEPPAGNMAGLHAAGLGIVARGDVIGVQAAGLATLSGGTTAGIQAALLGVLAEQDLQGVHAAGLALLAGRAMGGIQAAPGTVVAGRSVTGVTVAGLAVLADPAATAWFVLRGAPAPPPGSLGTSPPDGSRRPATRVNGISVAGLLVRAHTVDGIAVAGLLQQSRHMHGLAIAAWNEVRESQRGVSIGLVNRAARLGGLSFQLGLLNCIEENPPWARWLPLFNTRFPD